LLYYPAIEGREAGIEDTYGQTFSWILEKRSFDDFDEVNHGDEKEIEYPKCNSCFSSWLESDSNEIFWISGKAASGKSTLMKYLFHDSRTKKRLKAWAGKNDPILAAFFFFERGDTLQKSREGLLRSLLYQILSQRKDLVQLTYEPNWQDRKGPTRLPEITWSALKGAFNRLLERISGSTRLCLFVDGLDEYRMMDREADYDESGLHLLSYGNDNDFKDYPQGNWIRDGHHEIATIFQNIKRSNVKICLSSRELAPFEAAFSTAARLRVHELTKNDIHDYVCARLMGEGREHFYEDVELEDIAAAVVKHAEGVFLWVRLVVEELRKGQDDGDRIQDLWRKLMKLPKTLGGKDGLYMRMLDMSPSRDEAIHLFQLSLYHKSSPDLDILFYAADGLHNTSHSMKEVFGDTESSTATLSPGSLRAVKQGIEFQSSEQLKRSLGQMERRLKSRCMGLLEVPRPSWRVQFMHQTAKEFLYQYVHKALDAEQAGVRDFALEFLSAYVLQIKRRGRSSVDHLLSFAKSVDRIGDHRNETYYQLMNEVEILFGPPGPSKEHETVGFYFEKYLESDPRHDKLRAWDLLSLSVIHGLELYITMKLEREGVDSYQGSRLINILIKTLSTDSMKQYPPGLEILEQLLSHGADPHRKVGKSAFAMSAWETLLHLAVIQSSTLHELTADIISSIILISKLDTSITVQDQVAFLTYAGMRHDDLAPVWEGSLIQWIDGIFVQNHPRRSELISLLERRSGTFKVDMSAAPPFPNLPWHRSWKVSFLRPLPTKDLLDNIKT
jgi:hypothetical protein